MSIHREMLSNGEELRKDPRVKLSTIHSAKGGEADNVLLILDNTKTIRDAVEKSSDKQDEEHRVWYVGVTRTKQNLYIMAAKKEDQGYDIEVWDKQHGGSHYQKYKIQPSRFVVENELLYPEGCAIIYIIRHRDKGKKQDILKAIHFLEMNIERDYNENS